MRIKERKVLEIIRKCFSLNEYRSHASSINPGFTGLYYGLQHSQEVEVDKKDAKEIISQKDDSVPINQKDDSVPINQKSKDRKEANKFKYRFATTEKENINYEGKDYLVINLYKDRKFKNLISIFIMNRDNAGKGEWKKASVYKQDASDRGDNWEDISGTVEVLAILNAFLETDNR